MNKVLVFTNKSSWGIISDNIRERLGWSIYPNKNNPVMKCSDNSNGKVVLSAVSELADASVYLVYDRIDRNLLKQLLDNCRQDVLCVLIHTPGENMERVAYEDFISWKDKTIVIQGMHENSEETHYYPLFKILADKEGEKVERIIKSEFMPFAASDLLNDCLVPKTQIDKSPAYQILSEGGFKEDLDAFRNKYMSCNQINDYRQDLLELRDKLKKCF